MKHLDARAWIGIGVYCLTLLVIACMAFSAQLRGDEFFKTIATLIVGAFIKDIVGWAYSATQAGSELSRQNAEIVASRHAPATVQIDQPPDKPVPVEPQG
jgi:hypothetical protein